MGRLTTHVLDTAHGAPAADLGVQLYRLRGSERKLLREVRTNADGRCDGPLLEGDALEAGVYELVFAAGAYFARRGVPTSTPPFVDEVVVRFGVGDASAHYHVPLLVSPWSWSTYRGS